MGVPTGTALPEDRLPFERLPREPGVQFELVAFPIAKTLGVLVHPCSSVLAKPHHQHRTEGRRDRMQPSIAPQSRRRQREFLHCSRPKQQRAIRGGKVYARRIPDVGKTVAQAAAQQAIADGLLGSMHDGFLNILLEIFGGHTTLYASGSDDLTSLSLSLYIYIYIYVCVYVWRPDTPSAVLRR